MKIYDLLKQINNRFPTSADKERMFENFYKRRNELHVCDLDFALILIGSSIQFKNIDVGVYFGECSDLLSAIGDSSYAKYFAAS